MPKRRRESPSSSSEGDGYNAEGYGGARMSDQPPLANGNELCSAVSEQKETGPVASTPQLRGVIVKEEPEEDEVHEIIVKEELDLVDSEVEDFGLTTSPQLRIDRSYSCSATSTGQQSKPEERRKQRVSSKVQMMPETRRSKRLQIIPKVPPRPLHSRKVPAVNRHKKYSEGTLVMGCRGMGLPYWPGMIRKASADENPEFPVYTRKSHRKFEYFVQYFSDPTTLHWKITGELKVFDAANDKRNRCSYWDSHIVDSHYIAKFEKGIRLAKAATRLSLEARLAKCTLPRGSRIDGLLSEIENNQDVPEVPWDDSVASQIGLKTGGLLHQNDSSMAEDEDQEAPPVQKNRRSVMDVITGLKNQANILVQKDLEKEQVIKALTNDNSKLKTDNSKLKTDNSKLKTDNKDLKLQLQSKDELIAELHANLSKSDKDKLECMEELEKMRSELEGLEGIFKGQLEHK